MQMQPDGADLRKEPRYACSGLITILGAVDDKTTVYGNGLVQEISKSGARVQMDRPLQVGTEVILKNRLLEVRAAVRHVTKAETGFAIGLEFLDGFQWHHDSGLVSVSSAVSMPNHPGSGSSSPGLPQAPRQAAKPAAAMPKAANRDCASTAGPGILKALLAQIRTVHETLRTTLKVSTDRGEAIPDVLTSAENRQPGGSVLTGLFTDGPTEGVVLDRDLNIQYANSAFVRVFGADRILAKRDFRQFVAIEDQERVLECARAAASEPGVTRTVDFEGLTAAGSIVAVLSRWIYCNVSGKTIVHLEDVTARKRQQRQLIGGEIGLWNLDVRTGILQCSRELGLLCGMDRHNNTLDRASWLKMIYPDDRGSVELQIRKAIERKAPVDIQFRIIRPNGFLAWLASTGQVICDSDDKPIVISGAALDITQRKDLEEEARRISRQAELNRGAFHVVSDFLPVGIALVAAPTGTVICTNKGMKQLLDEQQDTPDGRDWMGFDATGVPCRIERWPIERSLAVGEVVRNAEITLRRSDATLVKCAVSSTPIYTEDGVLLGAIAVVAER